MTDAIDFALPLKFTHLSLPNYARIMGFNPVHFAGGYGTSIWPAGSCDDIWPRYQWQAFDRVSHETLADAIWEAERDIANVIGYEVAPTWIENEVHRYPKFYRKDMLRTNMTNPRGQRLSFQLSRGKFIEAGTRAVSNKQVATTADLSLQYTDTNADGFFDTAVIDLTTALADVSEIKVYFYNTLGEQEWEIRPCRTKSISGTTLTMTFDSWLFIDPDLQAGPPTTDLFRGLNLDTTANYVTKVDVYREYTDNTQPGAILYWEQEPVMVASCHFCSGVGCPSCYFTTQNGCIFVRDTATGVVAASAACYDASTASWLTESMAIGRDPDQIKVFYRSGEQSQRWLRDLSFDPLDPYLAQAIAYMATARLERDICACGPVKNHADSLKQDLAARGSRGSAYTLISFSLLDNPFGTRRGEIMAWKRVSDLLDNIPKGGAV